MKKSIILLGFALAAGQLHASDLNVIGTGPTAPNLSVDGWGGVLFKSSGTAPTTIPNFPITGAGARMMWFPAKSAFVAGSVNGTQWNTIGFGAAAFGVNNQVDLDADFAAGSNNIITNGWSSSALGLNNTVSGSSASTAIGQSNFINGGYNSLAFGAFNSVSHESSLALGEGNTSSGFAAAAIGRGLVSGSAGCVVVGMYNSPMIGNSDNWVGTDAVFIVGNGAGGTQATGQTGYQTNSNALVILKNGDVKLGKLQGDISGGEFAP